MLTVNDQCRVVSSLGTTVAFSALYELPGRLAVHEALGVCIPAAVLGSQLRDALPGLTGCMIVCDEYVVQGKCGRLIRFEAGEVDGVGEGCTCRSDI